MCYDSESSLKSFIIGLSSTIYLLNSEDKINKTIGIFFICVVSIQLLEYLMWIDLKCENTNYYATLLIPIVLTLQVYSIIFTSYYYDTYKILSSEFLKDYISIITLLFLFYISYNFINSSKRKLCSKKNDKYQAMNWDIEKASTYEKFLYYFIFIIGGFLLKDNVKSSIILVSGFLTFYFNLIENPNINFDHTGIHASRWCYFSAYVPLLIIFYDLLK